MPEEPPTPEDERHEVLLERLRELARRRDPVPEGVREAARSALGARRCRNGGRGETEAADEE